MYYFLFLYCCSSFEHTISFRKKRLSYVSALVLILDRAIPSGHASFTSLRRASNVQTSVNIHIMGKHASQTQILDVISHALLLQHPRDLYKIISCKNANLLTSSIVYWSLLHQVTVASSAMSAILKLSERRVDAVKSGSLHWANEFE